MVEINFLHSKELSMSTHNTTTTATRVVILGGGFAGVMAALRLAHRTRRQPVQITLVNASETFVERTRLHQAAAGQTTATRTLPSMLGDSGVHFVRGWVTALRPDERMVQINTDQGDQELAYDRLIYALGSFTALDQLPGAAEHALPVERHTAIAGRLMQLSNGARVLVVGGGLTGLEIATEIAESHPHLAVALVTGGEIGADLAPAGQQYVRTTLRRLHITVHEQTQLTRIAAGQAITAAGHPLPFDLCVMATGFAVSPLAAMAGIAVNSRKQVQVDPYLRSLSHPTIYAVGDAAALTTNTPLELRMACATALPLAAHAAENLARTLVGRAEEPFRFGYVGRCISLGRRAGLMQFVDGADRPRRWLLTGRLGAWAKERLLDFVMWTLRTEQRRAFYRWAQTYSAQEPASNQAGEWRQVAA
jgi:NADH:ubiquinone reductase (H+-translocating)